MELEVRNYAPETINVSNSNKDTILGFRYIPSFFLFDGLPLQFFEYASPALSFNFSKRFLFLNRIKRGLETIEKIEWERVKNRW